VVEARDLKITLRGVASVGTEFTLECSHFLAAPGTLTCIIGLNGSGKSTLLRILYGKETPQEGTIHIDSKPLKELTKRQIRRMVAWIEPGDTDQMVRSLRVQDHVAAALRLAGGRLPLLHRSLDVRNALSVAKLPSWLVDSVSAISQKRVGELSSGQKQAVRLALCFLQHKRIIFADESTSNLDLRSAVDFFNSLKVSTAEVGTTAVVVTHDLSLAAKFAQTVYLVRDHNVAPFDTAPFPGINDKIEAFRSALLGHNRQ